MVLRRLWLAPVLSCFFAIASFLISYAIGRHNNHLDAFWPFISDGGAKPPESCIFGQLLNLSALFLALSAYLRHRQIVEYYRHRLNRRGGRWRMCSAGLLMIAYVSSFTTSMVANFQETSVPVVHSIAAFVTFVLGLVYCWGQVVFSYAMKPRMVTIMITHCRAILCCFATFFLVTNISVQIAQPFVKLPPGYTTPVPSDHEVNRVSSDSPYFTNHIVVTLAEWLMAICFELFVITFAIELRHAYAHGPKLVIKSTAAIGNNDNNHRHAAVDNVKVSYLNGSGNHTAA